jgi:hypothetical protein
MPAGWACAASEKPATAAMAQHRINVAIRRLP